MTNEDWFDQILRQAIERDKAEKRREREEIRREESEAVIRETERRERLDADEWLRGGMDCLHGEPHKPGQPASYDRGYAAQYEWEQVKSEMSK